MSRVEKTDQPGMVRDRSTGLISNLDTGQLDVIRRRRREMREHRALLARIDELERRVTALEAGGTQ